MAEELPESQHGSNVSLVFGDDAMSLAEELPENQHGSKDSEASAGNVSFVLGDDSMSMAEEIPESQHGSCTIIFQQGRGYLAHCRSQRSPDSPKSGIKVVVRLGGEQDPSVDHASDVGDSHLRRRMLGVITLTEYSSNHSSSEFGGLGKSLGIHFAQ
ncbi:hypothetical protein MTR_3g449510 [Medicago truncatula]|uniref:Uncharacterized protein n=1 Tax=Medicago truncatula TaxID=3880 RepID=A0A072UW29_MEDTR|nr:hypothetical protein MTR_3g449510 [Medicago truncatula]